MADKPFNERFVIRVTLNNMRKAVDFSIQRTFARVAEFADDPEKSTEVFRTLSTLHTVRGQLDKMCITDNILNQTGVTK
jgi:hypothetical protein